MATNLDEPVDRSNRTGDDAGSRGERRDAETARRSSEADEHDAGRPDREKSGRPWGDWNAVGLVTSLVATGLFSVGSVLARSTQLTTVALFSLAAVAVLLVRRGGRRLR